MLSRSTINRLSKHYWFVETSDSITQNAIAEHLANKGEGSTSLSSIFYNDDTHHGFKVPFIIVQFLTENKAKVPYLFTAYHRERNSVPWSMWKEGKKTPAQKLKDLCNFSINTLHHKKP
ncbi:MAG: hypothetical protein RLZZ308_130 [Candidatus Parcubacteria bacterium]|jgi:hypothetical protein